MVRSGNVAVSPPDYACVCFWLLGLARGVSVLLVRCEVRSEGSSWIYLIKRGGYQYAYIEKIHG